MISNDIIYKRSGNAYFPYFIQTERPASNGNKVYSVVHKVYLRDTRQNAVDVIEQGTQNLYAEEVPFRKEYWKKNYRQKK